MVKIKTPDWPLTYLGIIGLLSMYINKDGI
jgi:hypothetical protein